MTDYAEVFKNAEDAATIAMSTTAAKVDPNAFDCGFAWVTVRPARGGFVSWCKAQIKAAGAKFDSAGNMTNLDGSFPATNSRLVSKYGSLAYGGGWQFWKPGTGYNGQSMTVFEAGARAFANVLVENGVKASVGTRLD